MSINKAITASVLFFVLFFVYCRTLNPVFHADDSPETIACSYTLGIQHPPGYPLSTLTGKIFSMIMPGNRGFAVNLQAAAAGSAAAVMLFLIMLGALGGKIPEPVHYAAAVSSALTFAFGLTFWSQSLSAKGGIYSMNAALLLGIIYSLMKWDETGKIRFLNMAAYIYGLSLANHWESMAAASPALAAYAVLILAKDGKHNGKYFIKAAASLLFILPGISAYAYLIIRSRTGAYLNWGDPENLKGLLWVLSRAEYTATDTARDMAVVLRQLSRAGADIFSQFTAFGLLLAAAGAFYLYRKGARRVVVLFGTLFFTITIGLSLYFNLKNEMLWIMDVFFIPAFAALSALAGAGVLLLTGAVKKGFFRQAAVFILAAAMPLWLFASNFRAAGQSGNYYAYDYGKNIIKSVDTPAIVMLEGDYAVIPMMYFKYVEKGVDFCPVTTILLNAAWDVENLKKRCPGIVMNFTDDAPLSGKIRGLAESNYRNSGIYTSVFRSAFASYYPEGNAVLLPHGAVMKMDLDKKAGLVRDECILKTLSYRGLVGAGRAMDPTTSLGMSNYSSSYMETGNAFSSINMNEKALYYLIRADAVATDRSKGLALTNLGVLYSKLGRTGEALDCYLRAVNADPGAAEAYSNMAGIYNDKKEFEKSIEACSAALKIKPDFPDAYNNMAIAYFNSGDRAAAVEFMEKAAGLDPADERVRKNLEAMKAQVKQ